MGNNGVDAGEPNVNQRILRGKRPLNNLPPRSTNLYAYAERFVRTIKEGCLEQNLTGRPLCFTEAQDEIHATHRTSR
jgi:hypothetical protein